jgi:NitT/TauT family transport system substrate-binding protein
MRTQHARPFSRREFLGGLTFAGTAGLLGLCPGPIAAEPPPETTTLRLAWGDAICSAPQYVAEALLQGEGFTEVQYLYKQEGEPRSTVALRMKALASGETDIDTTFASTLITRIEAADPILVLTGGTSAASSSSGRIRSVPSAICGGKLSRYSSWEASCTSSSPAWWRM